MKILFVVDSFSGGAGNVIQILAQEFSKRGYDVVVALLAGKKIEPRYKMNGVEILDVSLDKYVCGKTPIGKIINSKKFIGNIINDIKPDVIISFLCSFNVLCSMNKNKNRIPLIVSERNDPSKIEVRRYWHWLRRIFYNRADLIVLQCKHFKQFLPNKWANKMEIIPNPIVKPLYTKNDYHDIGKIRIITAGRLFPQKDFLWLVEAMTKLHFTEPNINLDIFGEGPERKKIETCISKNKAEEYIKLCGYSKDVYEELVNHDIYVMTSIYEGFPNALSEAMAVGLPSVSRECHPGIYDLVNYENGIVVKTNDIEGFVSALKTLVNNEKRRELIGNNAKRVSNEFSIEKITDIWEKQIIKLTEK